ARTGDGSDSAASRPSPRAPPGRRRPGRGARRAEAPAAGRRPHPRARRRAGRKGTSFALPGSPKAALESHWLRRAGTKAAVLLPDHDPEPRVLRARRLDALRVVRQIGARTDGDPLAALSRGPLRSVAVEIEERARALAEAGMAAGGLEERCVARPAERLAQGGANGGEVLRIRRVADPGFERVAAVARFGREVPRLVLGRQAEGLAGLLRESGRVGLRPLERHDRRPVLALRRHFEARVESGKLRAGDLEPRHFQLAVGGGLRDQGAVVEQAKARALARRGPLRQEAREGGAVGNRVAVLDRTAEQVAIEPVEVLLDLAPLMGDHAELVRLAGEEDEPGRRLADLLESPEQRPGLVRRHRAVDRAGVGDRRRGDVLQAEERRFLDVLLEALPGRAAEVIVVERGAEIDVSPVADPFDVGGPDRGRLVAAAAGDQLGGEDAAIRPAGRAEALGIDQAPGDQRVDPLFEIGDLELVVAAGDRFHPLEPVARAAVVIGAQHEGAALAEEDARRAPVLAPAVAVGLVRTAVDGEHERAFLARLPIERVVEDPFDHLALGALPAEDLALAGG